MFFLPMLLQGAGALIAAKSRNKTAKMNYALSAQNASINRSNALIGLTFDSIRNDQALSDANYNFKLAEMDAEARSRNAARLRQFAETRTEQGREGIRRQKRSFEQFESSQRASIGASGVEFSGSPMDVLAESAGQMQLAIQDAADQVNFERDENLNRATIEDYGATQDANRAKAGFRAAQNTYDLGVAANALGKLSAQSNYTSAMFGAAVGQAVQNDQSTGQLIGAASSIFAGAAGMYMNNQAQQPTQSIFRASYQGIR